MRPKHDLICVCVCSLQQHCVLEWAASATPTTSPASLTFWNTVSDKPKKVCSEKEMFLFAWSWVNYSPDTLPFFLFFIACQVNSVLFLLPKFTNQNQLQSLFNIKDPICLGSAAIFNAFQELFCCFQLFSAPLFSLSCFVYFNSS